MNVQIEHLDNFFFQFFGWLNMIHLLGFLPSNEHGHNDHLICGSNVQARIACSLPFQLLDNCIGCMNCNLYHQSIT